MLIKLEIPSSVYKDANNHLIKYGGTPEKKIISLFKEWAIESRRDLVKHKVKTYEDSLIDNSDLEGL